MRVTSKINTLMMMTITMTEHPHSHQLILLPLPLRLLPRHRRNRIRQILHHPHQPPRLMLLQHEMKVQQTPPHQQQGNKKGLSLPPQPPTLPKSVPLLTVSTGLATPVKTKPLWNVSVFMNILPCVLTTGIYFYLYFTFVSFLVREPAARDRRTVFVSDDMDVIEIPSRMEGAASDEADHLQTEQAVTQPSTQASNMQQQQDEDEGTPSVQHSQETHDSVTHPTPPATALPQPQPRQRRSRIAASDPRRLTINFMEKLKYTFFDKRKSTVLTTDLQPPQQEPQPHYPQQQQQSQERAPRQRKRSHKARPLSYPNFLMRQFRDDDPIPPVPTASAPTAASAVVATTSDISSTSSPSMHNSMSPTQAPTRSFSLQSALTSQTLSRQSTTHLAEIDEEDEDHHLHHQPLAVDT